MQIKKIQPTNQKPQSKQKKKVKENLLLLSTKGHFHHNNSLSCYVS